MESGRSGDTCHRFVSRPDSIGNKAEINQGRQVAIAAEASGALAAKLETLVPTGRRPKILAILPVRAELMVGGTFLRVLQDRVCLA